MTHRLRPATLAIAVTVLAFVSSTLVARTADAGCPQRSGPDGTAVIWNTDLLQDPNYGDVDDHIDLPVVYGSTDAHRVVALALDSGWLEPHPAIEAPPTGRLGAASIERIEHLTGRRIPVVPPVQASYTSTKAPPEPTTRLASIVEACAPVAIAVTGTAREVAFLLDHRPDLFGGAIRSIWLHAGDAGPDAPAEWNAAADPAAMARVLEAPTTIVWLPPFDGGPWSNEGEATWARPSLGEVFAGTERFGEYLAKVLARDWAGGVPAEPMSADVAAAQPNLWATPTLAFMGDDGLPTPLEGVGWTHATVTADPGSGRISTGDRGVSVMTLRVTPGDWDQVFASLVAARWSRR